MEDKSKRRAGPPGATMTGALALLLVICLAECASGSCLSYGHSCWGAHGKRSGPVGATDQSWAVVSKFLDNLNRARQRQPKNEDTNAIYRVDAIDNSAAEPISVENSEIPLEMANRNLEAKSVLNLWQLLKAYSEEK